MTPRAHHQLRPQKNPPGKDWAKAASIRWRPHKGSSHMWQKHGDEDLWENVLWNDEIEVLLNLTKDMQSNTVWVWWSSSRSWVTLLLWSSSTHQLWSDTIILASPPLNGSQNKTNKIKVQEWPGLKSSGQALGWPSCSPTLQESGPGPLPRARCTSLCSQFRRSQGWAGNFFPQHIKSFALDLI